MKSLAKKLWQKTKCWRGYHSPVFTTDEWGWLGHSSISDEWTCKHCGHYSPKITWPDIPVPPVKAPRIASEESFGSYTPPNNAIPPPRTTGIDMSDIIAELKKDPPSCEYHI